MSTLQRPQPPAGPQPNPVSQEPTRRVWGLGRSVSAPVSRVLTSQSGPSSIYSLQIPQIPYPAPAKESQGLLGNLGALKQARSWGSCPVRIDRSYCRGSEDAALAGPTDAPLAKFQGCRQQSLGPHGDLSLVLAPAPVKMCLIGNQEGQRERRD